MTTMQVLMLGAVVGIHVGFAAAAIIRYYTWRDTP